MLSVLLLVAGWLWWARDESIATPPIVDANRPVAETDLATGSETGAVHRETPAGRVPVAADATAAPWAHEVEPMGDLLVQVVWADRTKASGVRVYLSTSVQGTSRRLDELLTDQRGEVRAPVPAGKVAVSSDRGSRADVVVAAGRQSEVELKLPAGFDVEGFVRDGNGKPVAGARIWLTSHQDAWCAGAFVAIADARGAFLVPSVPKQQSLGAVAAGYAPSRLVDLELGGRRTAWGAKKAPPLHVELVLDAAGGALAGRVADELGRGVRGAVVAVGTSARLTEQRSTNTVEERWAPRRAFTDADGRYAIEGLAPGTHPIEVCARGFPIWRGDGAIEANARAQLDVTLLRPVTVRGIVCGDDGQPLAGASVHAFPVAIDAALLERGQCVYESTFGHASAVADAAGRYRLSGVAPGNVHLHAIAGGRHEIDMVAQGVAAVLHGLPGAVIDWHPVIDAGPTIRGVVRYRDGVPMAGAYVRLLEAGMLSPRVVPVGNDGRFRFVRLASKAYDVSVQLNVRPNSAPPVEARDVWPDAGELQLIAAFDSPKPPGIVRGTIVDAAGRLAKPGALAVVLETDQGSPGRPLLDGASFRIDHVEPGRMRVVAMSGAEPILFGPWFELQAAEQRDVGPLVTQPGGKLLLRIVRHPGTEKLASLVHLTLAGASHSRQVTVPRTVTEIAIDNLCAGEHRVVPSGIGEVSMQRATCMIVAGAEASATIELRAAVRREVVVDHSAAHRPAQLRVQDERGGEIFDFRPDGLLERPFCMHLLLPLGRFTLIVTTEGGGKAQTGFEMTSLAADQPPIVLQMK